MEFIRTEEFNKDLKRLKKYRTLENDLEILTQVIRENPLGGGSRHWNILKSDEDKFILKTRMMCRAVRGTSFRVIYFYDGKNIKLEFIEIYFKGSKSREDTKRINSLWKRKIT